MSKTLREGFQELRRQNDGLRQELGGGLGGRLGELHEELRDLRRALTEVREDVAETRRENAALLQELRAACREAAEGPSAPRKAGPAPHPGPVPPADAGAEVSVKVSEGAQPEAGEETLEKRLEKAAGIGAADLVCHRDTWAYIVEQAARNAHFRVPGEVSAGEDGQARVVVSGRSLMAILTALHAVMHQGPGGDPGDCALATKFYERIAAVVDTVRPDDRQGAGGREAARARTVIVIDDRPGPS
ncbi:hypothetical protein FGW37_02160 [Streptomyces rectiverticillatus]|uniref:hypothetical protein n=1 Tax=Streptomyces rectiverticillatus TaxID=173860 RepID=UPI0015C3D8F2|nr:hypothetical protein [Streptomyces rectiverticillatus]QLE70567.1 hypothetical protein FGW37_02160 [Streptomyces rectiverticillatus]